MNTDTVTATVALLLTADPDVADRDEVATIVRRSRQVRSWLDSVDVACARRTRELAAVGAAEPAESLLGDDGQRSTRESRTINKRVPVCDAMPLFEAALAAGLISGGHVDAVAAILVGLDDEIRVAFIAEQDALLAAAQRQRVEQFADGCRNLVRFLTAERDRATGADTEMETLARQRAASRIRQWADQETGMHHTHVELDPVRGAKLKKALADMLRRHRKTETNTGIPWNQLEVDSFLNGIDRAVTTRNPVPATATDPDARPFPTGTPATGTAHTGESPATAGPPAPADSHVCPGCTQRDGLSNGASPPPTPLADLRIPDIGVLIDIDSLLDGLHEHSICHTYDGIPIPISQVRRLCCDANIIPYVLNGKGEVTDLGRSTRTVSRAQRRTLRAMHTTCVGDGCNVSFEQCEIHHIVFWRFTGPTDIANLVPVCSKHHHLAHEGGWTLTMTPDRTVTWTRPDGTVHSVHKSNDRAPHGVGLPDERRHKPRWPAA